MIHVILGRLSYELLLCYLKFRCVRERELEFKISPKIFNEDSL